MYAVPLVAVLLALATGVALGAGPLTTTTRSRRRAGAADACGRRAPEPAVLATSSRPRSPALYAGRLAAPPGGPGDHARRRPGDRHRARLAGQGRRRPVSGTYAVRPSSSTPEQKSLVDTLGIQLATQVRPGRPSGDHDVPAHRPARRASPLATRGSTGAAAERRRLRGPAEPGAPPTS